MVEPDLEIPGNTASACAKPIKMASKNVIFTRSPRANRVLHKIQPVAIKNPHTAIGLAKSLFEYVFEQDSHDASGNGADYQQVDCLPGCAIASQTSDELGC